MCPIPRKCGNLKGLDKEKTGASLSKQTLYHYVMFTLPIDFPTFHIIYTKWQNSKGGKVGQRGRYPGVPPPYKTMVLQYTHLIRNVLTVRGFLQDMLYLLLEFIPITLFFMCVVIWSFVRVCDILSGICVYDSAQGVVYVHDYIIRGSVDSLCRDGADTPISLNIQNPSKLLNADILSLYRHLTLVLERFCTPKYP